MFDFEFGGTASFSKIYQKEKIFGYFAVDWSQSELYHERTVSASNFITMLSTMGGYSTVLTGFFGMLIASYQSFVFDKSMLKKMYFQMQTRYRSKDESGEHRHDEDELIERINNRKIFHFGYCGYGLIKAFSFCICCKRCLLEKWPYYKKNWLAYKKFKKARANLNKEKDIEHMIYNIRILRFMQKTHLKKRQRDIVQYFSRYLIEDDEIYIKDIS